MKTKHLLLAIIFALSPLTARAADYDLSIPNGGFYAYDTSVLVGETVKLYAFIDNLGTVDVEATAICKVGDSLVNAKPLSARANGATEEVWFTWTPLSPGTYTISLNIPLDGGISDPNPADNYAEIQFTVDTDADGDGIGDTDDPDDDNDGVPDNEDDYPNDPSRDTDTDGDGIDDSVDSDDDNDGLYDWEDEAQGSSPTDYDTDDDGVNDKDDAYPTDPNRSSGDVAIPVDNTPDGQVLGLEDIDDNSENENSAGTSQKIGEDGRVLGLATDTDEIYDEYSTTSIALESNGIYNIGESKPAAELELRHWYSWPNWLWLLALLTGLGAFIFFLIWRKRKKEKDEEEQKTDKDKKS